MRKILLLFTVSLFTTYTTLAQIDSAYVDSLKKVLLTEKDDTNKIKTLIELSESSLDDLPKIIQSLQQPLILARKLHSLSLENHILNDQANFYWNISNYPAALNCYLQSMKIGEQSNDRRAQIGNICNIANVYFSMGYFKKSLGYALTGKHLEEGQPMTGGFNFTTLGKVYAALNKMDSAMLYGKMGYDGAIASKAAFYIARSTQGLADIYFKHKDYKTALEYYSKAIPYAIQRSFKLGLSGTYQSIAEIYKIEGKTDSSIFYSQQALQVAQDGQAIAIAADAATFLANTYKDIDERKSASYLRIALAAKDSLYNSERNDAIENIDHDIDQRQKDKEDAQLQYENNLKFYGVLGACIVIAIVLIILLRNNKQRKKANNLLLHQKQKVESTLEELKSTQAQLIQSEKMASLGELTAGIAHEIQNPLNFVNNFSEVNTELIKEMQQEIDKGNIAEAKEISNDIKKNEEKINHHGKRAGDVVKGMLQHSRSSTGVKEPTDINSLADEYLRLSYHGLRAKDKSFNASMQTDFDNSIGKINIIGQDIGRVILNLINNAFYTVTEKKKTSTGSAG